MASPPFNTSYSRQLALWVLRAFSPSLARDLFIRHLNCADQDIAIFLGLPPEPDADNISAIHRQLGAMLAGMEKTPAAVGLPVHAIRNFAELGHLFVLFLSPHAHAPGVGRAPTWCRGESCVRMS